jgi:hypothetical protein
MTYRFKTGIGIVAASVALALLPAVTASASVDKSSTGSNPSSPVCQAYRSSVQSNPKSAAAASRAAQAIQKGNWNAAKKAYQQTYAIEAADVQKLVTALKNAPSKVKTAAGVLITYVNQYKTILEKSTSIKQFTKSATSLSKGAKTTGAANTLDQYYTSQCGTSGS